ncbi:inhibin beta B chain-like [Actinia tenebrosa]|uniref:Inhibin beta B chain-like n=1 Tax=Actinia tenebrosa TaxID=6105 RepID=A0A6P8H9W0_ACTTE|nr:inhibin beta B chain-like [Actinia tenebrosa]
MLPVLVLLSFATTQGLFVSAQNTASDADVQTHKIRVPRSPGASFTNNQSIPDNSTTADSLDDNMNIGGGCKRCGVRAPPIKGSLEYKLRIEMIKRQILYKLHMDEEPRIQRPKRAIPLPLVDAKFLETPLVREDVDAQEAKSAQVIVLGTKAISSHSRKNTRMSRKMHFNFHFSNKIYKNDILKATLWVYRSTVVFRGQTLRVADYDSNISKGRKSKARNAIQKQLESKDQGWVSVDVKTIVDSWITRTFKNKSLNRTNIIHTLELSCAGCLSSNEPFACRGQQRPFMVLDLATAKKSSRKKRAINCRPGMKDCCRQQFYVSFKDMGWHNWIMAPLGFNANYCTGSCYGHVLPVYHHTDILQKVAMLNQQREIAPCCSPTKLFGLSLIYFDKDENLFHENVPNMIVDECGCS